MNKEMTIWGRKLDLDIVFDVYDDEEILPSQETALNCFLEKESELFSLVDDRIISYCIDKSNGSLSQPIDNIFRFLVPSSLFIKRSSCKRKIILCCSFKYDIEHDVEIIYENEKLVDITS